jgi:hypothetical protein
MIFRRIALACIAALLTTFALENAPAKAGGYCGYGCGAQVMVVQPQPVFQPCGCAALPLMGRAMAAAFTAAGIVLGSMVIAGMSIDRHIELVTRAASIGVAIGALSVR